MRKGVNLQGCKYFDVAHLRNTLQQKRAVFVVRNFLPRSSQRDDLGKKHLINETLHISSISNFSCRLPPSGGGGGTVIHSLKQLTHIVCIRDNYGISNDN